MKFLLHTHTGFFFCSLISSSECVYFWLGLRFRLKHEEAIANYGENIRKLSFEILNSKLLLHIYTGLVLDSSLSWSFSIPFCCCLALQEQNLMEIFVTMRLVPVTKCINRYEILRCISVDDHEICYEISSLCLHVMLWLSVYILVFNNKRSVSFLLFLPLMPVRN